MFYKIAELDRIAPEYVRKFEEAGITTTEHLLAQAPDPKSRAQLAVRTGIGEKYLTRWLAMADLMQLKGIGRHYAELLQASGVDSIGKLRGYDPDELVSLLNEQKTARKLAGGIPKLTDVEQWMKALRVPVFARAK